MPQAPEEIQIHRDVMLRIHHRNLVGQQAGEFRARESTPHPGARRCRKEISTGTMRSKGLEHHVCTKAAQHQHASQKRPWISAAAVRQHQDAVSHSCLLRKLPGGWPLTHEHDFGGRIQPPQFLDQRNAEQEIAQRGKGHHRDPSHLLCLTLQFHPVIPTKPSRWARSFTSPIFRAGTPAQISPGGMSLVSTEPAPKVAF